MFQLNIFNYLNGILHKQVSPGRDTSAYLISDRAFEVHLHTSSYVILEDVVRFMVTELELINHG